MPLDVAEFNADCSGDDTRPRCRRGDYRHPDRFIKRNQDQKEQITFEFAIKNILPFVF